MHGVFTSGCPVQAEMSEWFRNLCRGGLAGLPYKESALRKQRAFIRFYQPLDSQACSFMLVYRYTKAEALEKRKMTTDTAAASSYSMLENSLRR